MKLRLRVLLFGLLAPSALLAQTSSPASKPAEPAALTLVKTIPLPGVNGRIDHFSMDAKRQRLILAALGNSTIEIVNVKDAKVETELTGFATPQGTGYASDSDRYIIANADNGHCQIFDSVSLKEVGNVDLKDDADNVRYDPVTKLFWVGYGSGGLAAIDPAKGQQVGNVDLGAHPESFQLETKGPRIFVNVPGKREVVVIDREKKSVLATWPVSGASSNFPMALDEAHHRLFLGCRRPAKLLVLDTESGKELASVDIVSGTDDVFYDGAKGMVYVSGSGGAITVVAQQTPDTYKVQTTTPTASGAQTCFFDPASATLYVAVPHNGAQQAEVRVFQYKP